MKLHCLELKQIYFDYICVCIFKGLILYEHVVGVSIRKFQEHLLYLVIQIMFDLFKCICNLLQSECFILRDFVAIVYSMADPSGKKKVNKRNFPANQNIIPNDKNCYFIGSYVRLFFIK